MNELADKIQYNPTIQDLKDYAREKIRLAEEKTLAEKHATKEKLAYERKFKTRFAELIEELKAVSKTEQAVELELLDDKEQYKLAEREASQIKDLLQAHSDNLWIAKLEKEIGNSADQTVNAMEKEEDDLPF